MCVCVRVFVRAGDHAHTCVHLRVPKQAPSLSSVKQKNERV